MPSPLKQHLCHTLPHAKPFLHTTLGQWHHKSSTMQMQCPDRLHGLHDEASALLHFSFCFVSQKCTLEAYFNDPLSGTATPTPPFLVIWHALIKQWERGIRKDTKLHSSFLHLLCPPLIPWRQWAHSRCAWFYLDSSGFEHTCGGNHFSSDRLWL